MVVSIVVALGPSYESAKNQIPTGYELPTLNATLSRLSRIPAEVDAASAAPPVLAVVSSPTFSSSRGRGRGRGSIDMGGG